ncbi:MAG: GHKL domain-containing protein [Deltaproteobacteria bacterium]|nr:GHKL domain-containing protein [Deltaproteobacteria bacterium]
MTKEQYYSSLTRKMILIVMLVSFAPLALIMALTGYEFHTSYKNKVIAHLEEIVRKHKQHVDGFLMEKLADLSLLASSFTPEVLSQEQFLQELLAHLRKGFGGTFADLGLVDEQGIQVAYAGPFNLGRANYMAAEWFIESKRSSYYISDVFLGLRGIPHFVIAVKKEWQGRQWIFRATIDFDVFNRLVENIRIGKTGMAFILSKAGAFQTKPRVDISAEKDMILEFIRKRKFGTEEKPAKEDRLVAPILAQNNFETGDVLVVSPERQFLNQRMIYFISPLKNGEWFLVYRQDEGDAFSDLYRARTLAFGVLLLGGLVIVVTAFLLSKRMVNRIARADREKEMMNEQVIETGKLASLGELAAGIAHEINNPVAIMVEEAGWIQDMLEADEFKQSEDYAEMQRAVNQIRTQGGRCKEINHKLLSFARRTDPAVKEVQLNSMVNEMADFSEQRAKYSNVVFRLDLAPDLPPIAASPSEIQQVLLNFVNNAIDAMNEKGGVLTMTTRRENDFIVLNVSDTGQGIPQANLQRIFDPFFTTKPVGKGTGLGLSICYGIIEKMGGRISVNSAVGVGTTFHIHLPVVREEDDDEEEQPDISGTYTYFG